MSATYTATHEYGEFGKESSASGTGVTGLDQTHRLLSDSSLKGLKRILALGCKKSRNRIPKTEKRRTMIAERSSTLPFAVSWNGLAS